MDYLNLAIDEYVVCNWEKTCVYFDDNQVEFYLTNKNLVIVDEHTFLFKKSTYDVYKFQIEKIQVNSGKHQIVVEEGEEDTWDIIFILEGEGIKRISFDYESKFQKSKIKKDVEMVVEKILQLAKNGTVILTKADTIEKVDKSTKTQEPQESTNTVGSKSDVVVVKPMESEKPQKQANITKGKTFSERIAGGIKNVIGAVKTGIATDANTSDSYVSGSEFKFCPTCGQKMPKDSKFCPSCGMVQGGGDVENNESEHYGRNQEYAGVIVKCPHCGATITHSSAVCPECNTKITGRDAVSSVRRFSQQLMDIELGRKKCFLGSLDTTVDPADKKKLTLIQSFPIPNTVDDILEFVLLAIANIDVRLSRKTALKKWQLPGSTGRESIHTINQTISDAWVSKLQQAYQKAELLFPNDPLFPKIKKIYEDKMKELNII